MVLFAPEVEDYLFELAEILHKKEYFGFKKSAVRYIQELVYEIINTLPNKVNKPAPPYFNRYGRGLLYSVFKRNINTQWYVFFHLENDVYFIRYIANNHTVAKHILDTN